MSQDQKVRDFLASEIFTKYGADITRPTFGDRIQHTFILTRQLMSVQDADRVGDPYLKQLSICTLFDLIPVSYWDEEFRKDLDDVYVVVTEAREEINCGVVWRSGVSERTVLNTDALLKAIVDLFDRQGLLAKKRPKEIIPIIDTDQDSVDAGAIPSE